jgi:hypothetical protein
MNFGTSTGVLTGTPTTVQSSTSYTITATNVTGSATATFTIAIADPVVVTTIYSVTYNHKRQLHRWRLSTYAANTNQDRLYIRRLVFRVCVN